MKATYITHACILLDLDGLKILTDPWLVGPCWGGDLWHFPTHKYSPKNLPKPDIIFFSHGHEDHYHEETLKNFPKNWFKALIVVPKFKEKWWAKTLNLKFRNVKYLNHNEVFTYNKNLKFQMFLNDLGDIDSSLKVTYKNKSCFFQTDNLMSIEEAERIGNLGKIDFAFVMPFLTGPFPGFYKMKTKILLDQARKKNNNSLNYCFNILKKLKPKNIIPYASDQSYLGENFHVNFIHTHDKRDLVKFLKRKNFKSKIFLMNPGDYFQSKNNKVFKKTTVYKFDKKALAQFLSDKRRDHLEYMNNEKKIGSSNSLEIIKKFKEKIKKEFKNIEKFNFKTLFLIKYANGKKFKLILDFQTKKAKLGNLYHNSKIDLKINIDSYKIKNLLNKRYPMNFLTFSNGGHICERPNLNLSSSEVKFWHWINNILF